MGWLRKAPRDGVQVRQMYPQPMREEKHPYWTFWYRFFLGRPMDGVRWTNSSFWRSATEGEDHWWLRLAGWHRALIRLTGAYTLILLTVLSCAWFLFDAHLLTAQVLLAHLIVMGVPMLLLTEWYFVREHGVRLPQRLEELVEPESDEQEIALRGEAPAVTRWRMVYVREGRRTWDEEVVRPVAGVAAEVLDLGWHPGEARKWVTVPRDYMEPGGQPVEILLPRKFTASDAKKKALLAAVKPRLGMMELEDRWLLKGRHPRLQLASPPAPPGKALFADYAGMLMASQEYRPFLGVAVSGELLAAEMVDDSPHIGLSAGSGAGKSKLAASVIAQALMWGWHVIILDWKQESHEWARGLPGVTYVSDEQSLHEMCVRIGQEIELRKNMSKDECAQRPRVLIVREEWNMTAALLTEYWMSMRSTAEPEERRTMPLRSPALTGLMRLVFAGRAFGMFDFLIAQRMSNRVFNGNTDLRENYQIRLLARYTVQTWKMLVGTGVKFIRKPTQLGRWVVVAGEEAAQVQGILGTDEEWRSLAMTGQPNPPYPFSVAVANGNHSQLARQPEAVDGEIDLALGDQLPLEVTGGNTKTVSILRKLVDISVTLDYLDVTEKALRNWRDREIDFPAARGGNQFSGYLYDLSEVTDWVRQRRASEAAKKEVRR